MLKLFPRIGFAAAFVFAISGFSQNSPVLISKIPGKAPNDFPTLINSGQITMSSCSQRSGLACAIPNLYGPYGLVLPNATHAAHFTSTFQSDFYALDTAIATQLTLLPLASPASGFTYKYDPVTGGLQQIKESFGPVLTERGETIGRHKLFFGATFQRFRFNKLDGIPMHSLPAVFMHEKDSLKGGGSAPFETQFISTQNSIDLKVNQFTMFGTFGITDHIDVSVAVPIMQIGLNVNSDATIERTQSGCGTPTGCVGTEPLSVSPFIPCCASGPFFAHFFDPNNPATSINRIFSNNQYPNQVKGDLYENPSKNSALGIGDLVLRLKGTVYRTERLRVALLGDLRLPTGDARNFLGSGAYGLKPSVAASIRTGWLTPHVNVGYQWNGRSVLAGDIQYGTSSKLPGFAFFSTGTDIGLGRRLTLAVDYLGQELINAPRIEMGNYSVTSGYSVVGSSQTSFPTIEGLGPDGIHPLKQTYNQSNLATGFKYNLFDKLIVTGNLLIALNNGGLRERVAPLIGLSYIF